MLCSFRGAEMCVLAFIVELFLRRRILKALSCQRPVPFSIAPPAVAEIAHAPI